MNPIPARKCNSFNDVCSAGVGAFCFDEKFTTIFLWLPNDTAPSGLRVNVAETAGSPSWIMTGSPEKPTLRPSINAPGTWHGWLTDGQFHL